MTHTKIKYILLSAFKAYCILAIIYIYFVVFSNIALWDLTKKNANLTQLNQLIFSLFIILISAILLHLYIKKYDKLFYPALVVTLFFLGYLVTNIIR